MASLIQELFHLVAGKNSFPPRESFEASSNRTAVAARFQRHGGQPQWLGQTSWISKLQAGAQVPTFELTLPKLFSLFHGHKTGMCFLGVLATSRWVLELRLVH